MKYYTRQIKPYIQPPALPGMLCASYAVDGYDWVPEYQEEELRKEIVLYDPWETLVFKDRFVEAKIGEFDKQILQDVIPYPLEGMIYYVETNEESDEAWIANKPIQYIDKEGYHCGWGLATLCFKFEDLNEVYFFSREEAHANLGGNK